MQLSTYHQRDGDVLLLCIYRNYTKVKNLLQKCSKFQSSVRVNRKIAVAGKDLALLNVIGIITPQTESQESRIAFMFIHVCLNDLESQCMTIS